MVENPSETILLPSGGATGTKERVVAKEHKYSPSCLHKMSSARHGVDGQHTESQVAPKNISITMNDAYNCHGSQIQTVLVLRTRDSIMSSIYNMQLVVARGCPFSNDCRKAIKGWNIDSWRGWKHRLNEAENIDSWRGYQQLTKLRILAVQYRCLKLNNRCSMQTDVHRSFSRACSLP